MADHYQYNSETCSLSIKVEKDVLASIADQKGEDKNWINFHDFNNPELIQQSFALFDIHRLTQEDIMQRAERPKIEEYEHYLYVTLKAIRQKEKGGVELEQISFILCQNTLLSYQEWKADTFGDIRGRLDEGKGVVRRKGIEYLLYLLINQLLLDYENCLTVIDQEIIKLSSDILEGRSEDFIIEIERCKEKLRLIRNALYPFREQINVLLTYDSELIPAESKPYFQDIKDNVLFNLDLVENHKNELESLTNMLFARMSQKSNEIMQFLTIVASIFIPLTFIAGIYGMNFEDMPELKSTYGYPIVLGVMLCIIIVMILFFRRRKWF